jgi:hypothetical protein
LSPSFNQSVQTEIDKIRAAKQHRKNRFFEDDLNWNEDGLHDLQLCKITPVDFPAMITRKLPNRYFNELVGQQPGELKVHSDHASISEAGLVHQVSRNVLAGFNFDLAPSSHTVLLFTCLVVDFLHSTFFIDELRGLSFDTLTIFERVRKKFGIDRVFHHLGQKPDDMNMIKHRFVAFLRDVLFFKVEQAFVRTGRLSTSSWDFLFEFIWEPHSSLTTSTNPAAERIRLGQPSNQRSSRRRSPDTSSLEVRFVSNRFFVPINITQLQKFVSKDGIKGLLLVLLCNPLGYEAPIATGARDDGNEDEDDETEETDCDCLKRAILEAPDFILSPMGKRRLDMAFPSHEITLPQARSLLQNKVKTISLKEIKSNIHHHAMTANDVMVGVFYDNQRKHCVLIDGSDGIGRISDPVEGYGKGLVRSDRTLKKLRITKFHQLYVLKRVELSFKSRKGLAKRTTLPFLPSLG